ncbi:sulfatase-like hydrolase/transferase [Flavihumibacter sp. R14]|nr:sulfatase-like hydrolase/transferase [Flavihumibacter soli]
MSQKVTVGTPMHNEIPDYPNIQKIKKAAALFINSALALFTAFIVIRIGEFVLILMNNDLPSESVKVVSEAVLFDLIFFLKLIPILFIPFVILYFIIGNKKVNHVIFGILGTIFILGYVLLIRYFGTALVPLGDDLFSYSLEEIQQTIAGNSALDLISICLVIIPIVLFWVLLYFFSTRKIVKSMYAYLILGTGSMLAYLGISALPSGAAFKNEFSYNLSLNKAAFFSEKTIAYFSQPDTVISELKSTSVLQPPVLSDGQLFKYTNADYPFLREDNSTDVLGEFFTIDSSKKPNIVFIQVEGLGRAFSGKNAYLESFTPFLDELADKSLYWENFLASQGRTFASLPSILGSLPFADQGFSDLGSQMPKHFSLLNILNQNGYLSKFYGGFEMGFDNQGIFMSKSGTKLIVSSEDYEHGFKKASSWGYSDRDLMLKSIQTEAKNPQQPFVTYLETISMHTPYTVPNQDQYIKMFEKRMRSMNFDDKKQKSYNQYKEIYSSIMYTDEALRFFFAEYAKLPAFNNTIFIITGDHRLPEIPMSTKIDRYHVPLIVYSPMLKRTASFKSVSSHLDITPSLVSFMKSNYRINTPAQVAWVGSGLDTAATLRNIHRYPLKQTRSSLHNYISGLHFIDQDQLFKVSDNMGLVPVTDQVVYNRLQNEFTFYKNQNNKFKQQLKLIPDNLYDGFIKK